MGLPKNDTGQNRQGGLCQLRRENVRFKKLLTRHGIAWEKAALPQPLQPKHRPQPITAAKTKLPCCADCSGGGRLSTRSAGNRQRARRLSLARGGDEWQPGICHRPCVKCGDYSQRQFLPVTDQVIYELWPATRPPASLHFRGIPVTAFSRLISTEPTGGKMPGLPCYPAGSSVFRRRWRFPALAIAPMPGSFLPSRFRHARPDNSGPH